jgi:hypothetical protein
VLFRSGGRRYIRQHADAIGRDAEDAAKYRALQARVNKVVATAEQINAADLAKPTSADARESE